MSRSIQSECQHILDEIQRLTGRILDAEDRIRAKRPRTDHGKASRNAALGMAAGVREALDTAHNEVCIITESMAGFDEFARVFDEPWDAENGRQSTALIETWDYVVSQRRRIVTEQYMADIRRTAAKHAAECQGEDAI